MSANSCFNRSAYSGSLESGRTKAGVNRLSAVSAVKTADGLNVVFIDSIGYVLFKKIGVFIFYNHNGTPSEIESSMVSTIL